MGEGAREKGVFPQPWAVGHSWAIATARSLGEGGPCIMATTTVSQCDSHIHGMVWGQWPWLTSAGLHRARQLWSVKTEDWGKGTVSSFFSFS